MAGPSMLAASFMLPTTTDASSERSTALVPPIEAKPPPEVHSQLLSVLLEPTTVCPSGVTREAPLGVKVSNVACAEAAAVSSAVAVTAPRSLLVLDSMVGVGLFSWGWFVAAGNTQELESRNESASREARSWAPPGKQQGAPHRIGA